MNQMYGSANIGKNERYGSSALGFVFPVGIISFIISIYIAYQLKKIRNAVEKK